MDITFCYKAFIIAAALLHITPAAVIPTTAPTPTAVPSSNTTSTNSTGSQLFDSSQTPDSLPTVTYSPDHTEQVQLDVEPSKEPIAITPTPTQPQGSSITEMEQFTGHDECSEPNEEDLLRQMKTGNHHLKNPEVALLKGDKMLDTKDTLFPTPESYSRYRYSDYNGTCPTDLLGVTGMINSRSICPWTLKENVNPTRYPPVIMYAECRCPDCIDPSSHESGFLNDGESTCRPVTFKMKVLHRRECMMGIFVYESVYEEIPVACACVRNHVA